MNETVNRNEGMIASGIGGAEIAPIPFSPSYQTLEAVKEAVQMNSGESTAVVEKVKPYTLRKLEASDVFTVSRIISKIGINEFKEAFNTPEVKQAIKDATEKTDDSGNFEIDLSSIGIIASFDIAGIVFSNIPKCEREIYTFLSRLSGMNEEEIATLDMVTFADMIVDVVKKEEFRGFIKAVSKLLK